MPSLTVVQRARRGRWMVLALCSALLAALVAPAAAQEGLAAPVLELPANAATGVSITPMLQWKAVTGATAYLVEGETNSEWKVLAWQQTTSATSLVVGPLQKGTKYHWRVRAINKVAYSAYSEIWYFVTGTEEPALGAPVLWLPANGATGVLQPPKLYWKPVPGALGYYVAVSTSADFGTTAFTGQTANLYVEVPGLAASTKYYWKVYALRGDVHGPSSDTWSFTTVNSGHMAAPVLISPPNGTTGAPLRPVLTWHAVTGAAKYYVQVAKDEAFSTPVYTALVAAPTVSVELPTLTKGTKYYWRVMAKNEQGQSPWSTVWWFTTASGEPPAAPVLISPAIGSRVALRPTLTWHAVTGATGYEVVVSASQSFVPVAWSANVTTTSALTGTLAAGTKYYWHVKAKNASGGGAWSATWYFVTESVERPAVPVLYAPANGATGVPTNVLLVWLASARASGYVVQVAVDETFAHVVWAQEIHGGTTAAEPLGLLPSTRYFWRVKAFNSVGVSDWSTIWRFTTKAPAGGS